jgi:nicotinate-nucleotide--dimethylbenzimidazole phosphoribosyltransferase
MSEAAQAPLTPAVSFAEIRQLVRALPALDPVGVPQAASLGRVGEWLLWLAKGQGQAEIKAERVRLALYAGAHGCAPGSAAMASAQLEALAEGRSAVNRVLQQVDADLRVYELDLDTPTADFSKGPALSEDAAAHAMAYGMMAVEPGLHLLAVGGLNAGGDEAYAALAQALPASEDILATLAQYGGLEICAMIGAILAARLAKVPVLLDGQAAELAVATLARMSAQATGHCASASALEPDLTDRNGLAAALGLARLKALAALVD